MFDDLKDHFYEGVIVPYEQYEKARHTPVSGRSKDLKLALSAASALYHFREHLQPMPARAAVVANCPAYKVLRSVVDASKHRELTGKDHVIQSIEAVEEVVVTTELADEDGPYYHARKVVMVTLNDGSQVHLHEIMREVINFWIRELKSRGVIDSRDEYAKEPYVAPLRSECSDESGAARMDIEGIAGHRIQQSCQLKRLQVKVDRRLSNQTTGVTVHRVVALSVAESTRISQCASDSDRKELLQTLPSIQEADAAMVEELTREGGGS